MSLNPVAIGILTGGLLGGAGLGPLGSVIGGGIGAMYDSNQGKMRDAQRNMRKLQGEGIANQNAVVEENYNKRKSAFGIGEKSTSPMGNAASQTGAILNSPSSGNSILG